MDELSIKVNVANRIYPLTISRDEEEGIRKAAKLINERIKNLESTYDVRDVQDLLAMVALEYANQSSKLNNETTDLNHNLTEKASQIDEIISGYLENIKVH